MRVLFLAVLALLVAAPAAHAQALGAPTVTSGAEHVEAAQLGFFASPRDPVNPSYHTDPAGPIVAPQLKTSAGSDVAITIAGTVERASASLAGADVPLTRLDEHTWKLTLSPQLALPAPFALQAEWSDAASFYTQIWAVDLVSVLPGPIVTTLPGVVLNPPATVTAGSLKVKGRRFSVTLACAADAYEPCHGAVILRGKGIKVARINFAGLPAGSQRVLTATVPASTLRTLRRHKVKSLTATAASPTWMPVTTRLPLPSLRH